MLSRISKYLKFGNSYCAIELAQNGNDITCHGLILKKKKKELFIAEDYNKLELDTLSKKIPKNKPVGLVINTDSVLTKCVETSSDEALKVVHLAFPNIKIEDFYYEILNQNQNCYVSICRKEYIEETLKRLANTGITVIDFSIGNLISSTLLEFVNDIELSTSNASIKINKGQIQNLLPLHDNNDTKYTINGLDIETNQILSFSKALSILLQRKDLESNFSVIKKGLKANFSEKLFFNQFIKIGFGLLFIVLLVNMFIFSSYQDKVGVLQETAMVLEISKKNLVQLKQKVNKSQKKVEDVLKSNTSKSSFYLDDIITSLPESILLKQYRYSPLLKKIKDDKPVLTDSNSILVSGSSNNSSKFSEWISNLEIIDWIISVEIQNFEDLSKSESEFSLKITIDHEAAH